MKYPYLRILFVELNRKVRQERDYARRRSSALLQRSSVLFRVADATFSKMRCSADRHADS